MRANDLPKPAIFKLNRKQLAGIFEHLDTDDLVNLRFACRRLHNAVTAYIDKLQVLVNWDGGLDGQPSLSVSEAGFRPVIVRYCSPFDFFHPKPAFPGIRQLFLCFEDVQEEPINLTELMELKFLKIRGANIRLSRNQLPNVTHIDIDDPDNCEKQVFRNLKCFNLEFCVDEFAKLKNVTESEAIDYAFKKSFDILLDKKILECASFLIIIANMELLVFEKFIDSLTSFLRNYRNEIRKGYVGVRLKHELNYKQQERDQRRWKKAWTFLTNELVEQNQDILQLQIKAFAPRSGHLSGHSRV